MTAPNKGKPVPSNEAVVNRLDGEKNSDLGYLGHNRAPVTPSQTEENVEGNPVGRLRGFAAKLQVFKQSKESPCRCIGGVSLVVGDEAKEGDVAVVSKEAFSLHKKVMSHSHCSLRRNERGRAGGRWTLSLRVHLYMMSALGGGEGPMYLTSIHFSRFFSESSDRKGSSVCPLVC